MTPTLLRANRYACRLAIATQSSHVTIIVTKRKSFARRVFDYLMSDRSITQALLGAC